MQDIFPETAARVAEWVAKPEVLGVVHVGSKSRGHGDELSDDDLEILLTDEAFAKYEPKECLDLLITGEGESRRMIYDSQITILSDLQRKENSPFDLDHWPYEGAPVLFDRDGRVTEAVQAAGRMDPGFRSKRLLHATIDSAVAVYRAKKTFQRGFEGAGRLLVARGVRALSRVVFALEWRWVPLDHWLEPELMTLEDPAQVGPAMIEALMGGRYEPLAEALKRLEERLASEGVPSGRARNDAFMEVIHPSRAEERAIHGLH